VQAATCGCGGLPRRVVLFRPSATLLAHAQIPAASVAVDLVSDRQGRRKTFTIIGLHRENGDRSISAVSLLGAQSFQLSQSPVRVRPSVPLATYESPIDKYKTLESYQDQLENP
jgi:hypothetical protein